MGGILVAKLLINTIDAGKIELEIGEGVNLRFNETLWLKAFVHHVINP